MEIVGEVDLEDTINSTMDNAGLVKKGLNSVGRTLKQAVGKGDHPARNIYIVQGIPSVGALVLSHSIMYFGGDPLPIPDEAEIVGIGWVLARPLTYAAHFSANVVPGGAAAASRGALEYTLDNTGQTFSWMGASAGIGSLIGVYVPGSGQLLGSAFDRLVVGPLRGLSTLHSANQIGDGKGGVLTRHLPKLRNTRLPRVSEYELPMPEHL